jgi:hypothetical protein
MRARTPAVRQAGFGTGVSNYGDANHISTMSTRSLEDDLNALAHAFPP